MRRHRSGRASASWSASGPRRSSSGWRLARRRSARLRGGGRLGLLGRPGRSATGFSEAVSDGEADFAGVFDGLAEGAALLASTLPGASGRSLPRLVGVVDRSAGAVELPPCVSRSGAAPPERTWSEAVVLPEEESPPGSSPEATATAPTATAAETPRSPVRIGTEDFFRRVPRCRDAAPNRRFAGCGAGRRFVSGGACGGSSMASHALCLPRAPDALTASIDSPCCRPLIEFGRSRIASRLIDFPAIFVRYSPDRVRLLRRDCSRWGNGADVLHA